MIELSEKQIQQQITEYIDTLNLMLGKTKGGHNHIMWYHTEFSGSNPYTMISKIKQALSFMKGASLIQAIWAYIKEYENKKQGTKKGEFDLRIYVKMVNRKMLQLCTVYDITLFHIEIKKPKEKMTSEQKYFYEWIKEDDLSECHVVHSLDEFIKLTDNLGYGLEMLKGTGVLDEK